VSENQAVGAPGSPARGGGVLTQGGASIVVAGTVGGRRTRIADNFASMDHDDVFGDVAEKDDFVHGLHVDRGKRN